MKRAPRFRSATALLAAALAAGCGGQQPLPGSARSLDALGRAVLGAFEEPDREALERFRLTEIEHNTVVWPQLPAAQGPSPYPADVAWRNIELRNGRSIPRSARALDQLRPLRFDSVRCKGDLQSFETFRVHTDCYTHFLAGGHEYRVQLFKDVLERNGGYKIFRYYDEDIERVSVWTHVERQRRSGE